MLPLLRVIAAGTGLLYAYAYLSKQRNAGASSPRARELLVVGRGSVAAKPDMAHIRFGVSKRDKSAKVAAKALQNSISKVLNAVRELEAVQERDLRTTRLSLHEQQPNRHEGEGKKGEREYLAQSQVELRLKEIDALALVLDTASEAGANEVESIDFDIQRPEPLQKQARALAIKDAKQQAQTMAANAGLSLGRIMTIRAGEDDSFGGYSPSMQRMCGYADSIASGEIAIEEKVSIRFELLEQ